MYEDFSTYHDTLKDKLSHGAIDVSAEDSSGQEEGILNRKLIGIRSSLFNPIQDVEEGDLLAGIYNKCLVCCIHNFP